MRLTKLNQLEPDGYIYIVDLINTNTFKVGKTNDMGNRLKWLELNYGKASVVHYWEVPSLDFCESVALAMTSEFSVGETEHRKMLQNDVIDFMKKYTQFISDIDNPSFKESRSNTVIRFICWKQDDCSTETGKINGVSMQELKSVAEAIIRDNRKFSRLQICKHTGMSQGRYTRLYNSFMQNGFLSDDNQHTQNLLTDVGRSFLEELL